uniref:Mediator complex subunit 4 n=1 Tax=Rhabditophanes sp. KR3021 TaxID=114890 RepID=A0AC35TYT8_9BILA
MESLESIQTSYKHNMKKLFEQFLDIVEMSSCEPKLDRGATDSPSAVTSFKLKDIEMNELTEGLKGVLDNINEARRGADRLFARKSVYEAAGKSRSNCAAFHSLDSTIRNLKKVAGKVERLIEETPDWEIADCSGKSLASSPFSSVESNLGNWGLDEDESAVKKDVEILEGIHPRTSLNDGLVRYTGSFNIPSAGTNNFSKSDGDQTVTPNPKFKSNCAFRQTDIGKPPPPLPEPVNPNALGGNEGMVQPSRRQPKLLMPPNNNNKSFYNRHRWTND